MSSGLSKLSLQSCNVETDKKVDASKCKINSKEAGSIFTEMIDCTNKNKISYSSDE